MILEVDDRGRIERIAVVDGTLEKTVDGRKFIGGYRLNTGGFESIWFDRAVWDVSVISDDQYYKTYRLVRKES